jgi:hypothetical protein
VYGVYGLNAGDPEPVGGGIHDKESCEYAGEYAGEGCEYAGDGSAVRPSLRGECLYG